MAATAAPAVAAAAAAAAAAATVADAVQPSYIVNHAMELRRAVLDLKTLTWSLQSA